MYTQENNIMEMIQILMGKVTDNYMNNQNHQH